ncbi:hypothetical protein MLD38_034649 [Melastoma candidum]|uniref:Uncharacterized protein n=1 Tax=Melastoma candidum TaxID=119954 RepID=A0ACB9MCV6_9MYRT|nr:hypothetical protein MLD38_034649 [Melastoma candidum]
MPVGILRLRHVLVLLVLLSGLCSTSSGGTKSMGSVPDLQQLMYTTIDSYPCVRLLSLSGEVGCANPGRDKVVSPIVKLDDTTQLTRPSAVLLSVDQLDGFFKRISNDADFSGNVFGALVESESPSQNSILGFSPADKFPQAIFAPYQNSSYEWNPLGSGILQNVHQFPLFLLSENSSSSVHKLSTVNEKSKKDYTAHVAEFDLVMQTTKSETRDTQTCLEGRSCLPLGGYRESYMRTDLLVHRELSPRVNSVLSSLPPINVSQTGKRKPIILTITSMDSASFFRDKNLGAESPISGLIAMLAAVDALSHLDSLVDANRQLVFLAFTGEAWGYLGSRRFLLELDLQSDYVGGLDDSSIEMVLEIGSVGKAGGQGVSSATNETMDAFLRAKDTLDSQKIEISYASASNPGIPPSSLMSFLKKNPATSGIVLEDFDSTFSNKFYHSHLDANINASSITAAASLVARTLFILATNTSNLSNSAVSTISANISLVEELMGCLLTCDPGLSCHLVQNYIVPRTVCPSHYVGVMLGAPSSNPGPGFVDDISRFIWNFLAEKTSVSGKNSLSACGKNCSKDGVCIRSETNPSGGTCVLSTTRYVPAYSTRLMIENDFWKLLPGNSSDPMGMVDPVWTESNWDTIGLRVYTVQDSMFDHFVLLGGIAITLLAYLMIVTSRAFIEKALKRD